MPDRTMFPEPIATEPAPTHTFLIKPLPAAPESDRITLTEMRAEWQRLRAEDLENELRALQTRINWIRAQLGKYPKCPQCRCEVR